VIIIIDKMPSDNNIFPRKRQEPRGGRHGAGSLRGGRWGAGSAEVEI
jgi:hypothetical protein